MLSQEGCLVRRKILQGQFNEYDLLLISQPRHIFYLSGFLTQPTELAGWGLNFLLLDKEGRSLLLVDNWNEGAAAAAFVDRVKAWTWYDFSGAAEEKYAGKMPKRDLIMLIRSSALYFYLDHEIVREALERQSEPAAGHERTGAL